MRHSVSLFLLAIFFIVAGGNHFRNPQPYLAMMPSYLPWHLELVWISGLAEIAGGLGILLPTFRQAAGKGLILLLIAVFPANINAAINGFTYQGYDVPAWILWIRLPFQFLLIYIVWRLTLNKEQKAEVIKSKN